MNNAAYDVLVENLVDNLLPFYRGESLENISCSCDKIFTIAAFDDNLTIRHCSRQQFPYLI